MREPQLLPVIVESENPPNEHRKGNIIEKDDIIHRQDLFNHFLERTNYI